ncbi:hypothetical protein C8Q76DRAFT_695439 [Earliella scabrosa]|nr:hypothetical protein C8Q76DRAFT_695439 [Earliella scabrosa]
MTTTLFKYVLCLSRYRCVVALILPCHSTAKVLFSIPGVVYSADIVHGSSVDPQTTRHMAHLLLAQCGPDTYSLMMYEAEDVEHVVRPLSILGQMVLPDERCKVGLDQESQLIRLSNMNEWRLYLEVPDEVIFWKLSRFFIELGEKVSQHKARVKKLIKKLDDDLPSLQGTLFFSDPGSSWSFADIEEELDAPETRDAAAQTAGSEAEN